MSKISNDGAEQLQTARNALNSIYDKLNQTVYTKSGKNYNETNVFNSVKEEFAGIAKILADAQNWEKV